MRGTFSGLGTRCTLSGLGTRVMFYFNCSGRPLNKKNLNCDANFFYKRFCHVLFCVCGEDVVYSRPIK